MHLITDEIGLARLKLLNEYRTPTRIELNKEDAKKVAHECGVDLPDNWNPDEGENVGLIFGIPMFIRYSAASFIMFAPEKITIAS